ncbi:MAG: SpoIID/LytB domain-containing protein [Candidatus Nanopelagicales bacterium]|jgi:SpoIID/LytB domain protein|nr:SpoIID/LytB domain-containing protein [Candidatus Nanopelagicales bacterium]
MRVPALRPKVAAVALAVVLAPTSVGLGSPVSAAEPEVYPVPADGVFRMQGSGWGHGRGMSQWGAHQAASVGVAYAQILSFYYPNTTLAPMPDALIRVLLASDTGRDLVVRATPGLTVRQVGGDAIQLPVTPSGCASAATRWRVRATKAGMNLAAYCGKWRKVDRVVGGTAEFAVPDGLVGTQNGSVRRGYRGTVTALRTGSRSVQVVNTLPMELYLRPVVAAEVSPSWPVEALRAQAVAARSYAAHGTLGRAKRTFDVYDSTRSQAYPGAVWYDSSWRVVRTREHPNTNAAIADTAGQQVTAGGLPALTQFSSSNGGTTAASPLPYMVAQADPWDAVEQKNPRLAWTDTVTAAQLRARCPGAGDIAAVRVLAREGAGPWGGRISRMEIVGTDRTCTLATDSAIRATLGVNSSVLTFTG